MKDKQDNIKGKEKKAVKVSYRMTGLKNSLGRHYRLTPISGAILMLWNILFLSGTTIVVKLFCPGNILRVYKARHWITF